MMDMDCLGQFLGNRNELCMKYKTFCLAFVSHFLLYCICRHIAENIKAPCLFATHFHELTELSKEVPSISNLHVEAITSEGDIIFLYNVKPGEYIYINILITFIQ